MKRNIKLVLQYDGTRYHGFQKQIEQGVLTVEEKLKNVLEDLLKEPIKLFGAGRTDAGVHAEGQVANFFCNSTIPTERLAFILNGRLPKDMLIVKAEDVSPDFHARYHAKGKHYVYTIYNSKTRSPFHRLYAHFVSYDLDFEKMRKACKLLEGTHDFKAFSAAAAKVKNFERTIYSAELIKNDCIWEFHIKGSGFVHNMVRIIVGALIEIGRGKKDLDCIERAFIEKERSLLGPTAPPHGLCLKEVYYSDINLDK